MSFIAASVSLLSQSGANRRHQKVTRRPEVLWRISRPGVDCRAGSKRRLRGWRRATMGALRKPQGRRGLNPVHHLDARTAHKYCVSLRAEELFCESVHIRHCGVGHAVRISVAQASNVQNLEAAGFQKRFFRLIHTVRAWGGDDQFPDTKGFQRRRDAEPTTELPVAHHVAGMSGVAVHAFRVTLSVFDKGIITRHLKNGANLHQTAAIGENSKRRFSARYGRSPLGAALFWLSRRPPADPGHSTRKVKLSP